MQYIIHGHAHSNSHITVSITGASYVIETLGVMSAVRLIKKLEPLL